MTAQLPYPEDLCREALKDNGPFSVPKQLATIADLDFDSICEEFDEITDDDAWRAMGVKIPHIFAWAARHGRGCCAYHGSEKLQVSPGPRPICFTVWGSRAYFYTTARIRKRLLEKAGPEREAKRQRREARVTTTPLFEEWREYMTLAPGHFYVEADCIDGIRHEWMAAGLLCRAVLKDVAHLSTISHTFPKKSAQQGTCTVHSLPQFSDELCVWAKNLGIPYRGESMQRLCYIALITLLKRQRERVHLCGEEKYTVLERTDFVAPRAMI